MSGSTAVAVSTTRTAPAVCWYEGAGSLKSALFRAGELVHGYLAKPEPRSIDHFEEVIRGSYRDSATFMNAVVVERFFPGRSVRIHNLTVT